MKKHEYLHWLYVGKTRRRMPLIFLVGFFVLLAISISEGAYLIISAYCVGGIGLVWALIPPRGWRGDKDA